MFWLCDYAFLLKDLYHDRNVPVWLIPLTILQEDTGKNIWCINIDKWQTVKKKISDIYIQEWLSFE